MSEEEKKFDKGSWIQKAKELREMDIFISEYLFNRPVFMWWWVSNHDGCDMIDYFNHESYRGEEYKEPLYEVKKDDPDYYEIDMEREERLSSQDENFYNGVHRWNLKRIPEYSRDLNLIHSCEEKLKELGLEEQYGQSLECVISISIHNGGEIITLSSWTDLFKIVNCNSETKAKAIVKTLKYVQEKEKWLKQN